MEHNVVLNTNCIYKFFSKLKIISIYIQMINSNLYDKDKQKQ